MDDETFVAALAAAMAAALRLAAALVGFDEAEDCVQDATIRAWRGRASLQDASMLRSWWLRIVYTTCVNWHKKRTGTHQRRTVSLETDTIAMLAQSTHDVGDSDHVAQLDLYAAINRLNDLLRPVIILRYFAGLDSTTIGNILQLPAPTVRTRLRKGLGILRDHLLVNVATNDEETGADRNA